MKTALSRNDLEALAKHRVELEATDFSQTRGYIDPIDSRSAAEMLAHAVLELLEVSDAAREEALTVYKEREAMRSELAALRKQYHLEVMANADVKDEFEALKIAHAELKGGYEDAIEENGILRRKVQVALAEAKDDKPPIISDTDEESDSRIIKSKHIETTESGSTITTYELTDEAKRGLSIGPDADLDDERSVL